MYRYILRESCSQFDSLPLTSLNIIAKLGEIFKDLAHLVTEQGSILDRIDYNLELAVENVESGNVQLAQAAKHQKSASKRALVCILILVGIIIVLMIALLMKHVILRPKSGQGARGAVAASTPLVGHGARGPCRGRNGMAHRP